MLRTALRAFTTIVTIRMCSGAAFDIHWYRFVYERLSLNIAKENSFNTTWSEYVTSPQGSVISLAGKPKGPRESRYEDTERAAVSYSRFVIKNVSLSDGGHYQGYMHGFEPNHIVNFDLLVIAGIECNETENHKARIGENITYVCAMTCQGKLLHALATWGGPGVTEATALDDSNKVACNNSKPHTCFTGIAYFSVTLPVTLNLDGTTRNFSIIRSVRSRNFDYTTGNLTVMCPGGMKGDDCNASMTCADNPCEQGAPCNDTAGGSFRFTCNCTEQYTGIMCHVPVKCSDTTCENGGSCDDNGTHPFSCRCADGYSGLLCQVAKDKPSTTKPKQKGVNPTVVEPHFDLEKISGINLSFLPYLSLLLIPLFVGAIVIAMIIYRRRKGAGDDDDEGRSSGLSTDDLSSESS